jgi:hypothetical protein
MQELLRQIEALLVSHQDNKQRGVPPLQKVVAKKASVANSAGSSPVVGKKAF